jgi:hypothetical protein
MDCAAKYTDGKFYLVKAIRTCGMLYVKALVRVPIRIPALRISLIDAPRPSEGIAVILESESQSVRWAEESWNFWRTVNEACP